MVPEQTERFCLASAPPTGRAGRKRTIRYWSHATSGGAAASAPAWGRGSIGLSPVPPTADRVCRPTRVCGSRSTRACGSGAAKPGATAGRSACRGKCVRAQTADWALAATLGLGNNRREPGQPQRCTQRKRAPLPWSRSPQAARATRWWTGRTSLRRERPNVLGVVIFPCAHRRRSSRRGRTQRPRTHPLS